MSFTWKTTAVEAAAAFQDQIRGKVVLITGASAKSIGQENVKALAPYAETIIVAGRSQQRMQEALLETRKENPSSDIRLVTLDLDSVESIRAAAAEVLNFNLPIHVLVNNAAPAMYETLTKTKDGFEGQFGANYLGHWLLTSLLFPAIKAAATSGTPARVINISSVVVNSVPGFRWEDPNYELKPEEYGKYLAYGNSKIAQVLFAKELSKRYAKDGVIAFSLHPGAVWDTTMGAAVPKADLIAMGLMNEDGTPAKEGIAKTIAEGTATQIVASFDPSLVSQPGAYLDDSVVANDHIPENLNDPADAQRLWELTEKILGQKFSSFK